MNKNFSHDQSSFTQQMHLNDYLNIIRRRKWVIITFFLFVVFIVAMKTLSITPVYKATTQIIIERRPSHMIEKIVVPVDFRELDYYQTQFCSMDLPTDFQRLALEY